MLFYNGGKKVPPIPPKTNLCKTCGGHDSVCDCNFKKPDKTTPLNSDCILINSVVCSKTVQKVAEATLPLTLFTGLTALDQIISIDVTPNTAGITQNARIIKDKVVNMGVVPVTITIRAELATGIVTLTLNTDLPFQAHTDCPGACPEDILQETPLQVEGTFIQPGVPVVTGTAIANLVTGILFKIILRTTITVIRPVILDKHGDICDLTDRCDPTTPPTFTFPSPANGG